MSKLTRSSITQTIALASLLALPAGAGPAGAIPRPLRVVEGHLNITVNSTTGAYVFTDWGGPSHTGLFSNTGTGVVNLATGQFLSGTGVVVAANGDTIHWTIGDP